MFKIFLIFIALLATRPAIIQQKENGLSIPNQSNSNMSKPRKKPNIKEFLGKERASRVARVKRVTVYHVKDFVTEAGLQEKDERKYFADHEVLSSHKIDNKKIKELKRVLLDANNYMDLEYINKCTFTATIGFKLTTNKETMNVLISYPCKTVLFIENGQEFYRDWHSVKRLDQIAQIFLKDLPKID